jgi:hypothetical protein
VEGHKTVAANCQQTSVRLFIVTTDCVAFGFFSIVFVCMFLFLIVNTKFCRLHSAISATGQNLPAWAGHSATNFPYCYLSKKMSYPEKNFLFVLDSTHLFPVRFKPMHCGKKKAIALKNLGKCCLNILVCDIIYAFLQTLITHSYLWQQQLIQI